MAQGRDVVVNLFAKFRGEKAFADLQKALSRLGPMGTKASAGLDKIVSRLAGVGVSAEMAQTGLLATAGAAVTAGAAIVAEMHAAAQAASALAEQVNATKVTFGESSEEVLAWAETTATGIGVSNRAALEAAQAFGGMFINMGFTGDAAADMSKGMVQLAGDLASLKHLSADEALQKLQSGLSGEIEPLRRLGVDVSEAAVKAAASQKGLTGELSQAQKVALRYGLIMEQLATAQGDYGRTADSLANRQRTLAASFEDMQSSIGQLSAPALSEMVDVLQKFVTVADDVSGKSGGAGEFIGNATAGAIRGVPVFGALVTGLDLVGESEADAAKAADVYADALAALTQKGLANAKSAEEQREALEHLGKTLDDLPDKLLAVKDAELSIADAIDSTKDAQEDLADLRSVTLEELGDISDAEERLTEALYAAGEASNGAEEAERSLAAFQASEGERAARLMERAHLDVAQAAEKRQDAEEALEDAQAELARVSGDPSATPRQIAEANDKLADAQLDVRAADLSAKEAGDELTEAQRQQRVGTDELRTATEQAKSAHDANRDAIKRVNDATRELDETRLGAIGTADEIADAERRVEQALLGEERAARAATKAHQDLNAARVEIGAVTGPNGAPNVAGGGTVRDFDSRLTAAGPSVSVSVTGNTFVGMDEEKIGRVIADKARLLALTLT